MTYTVSSGTLNPTQLNSTLTKQDLYLLYVPDLYAGPSLCAGCCVYAVPGFSPMFCGSCTDICLYFRYFVQYRLIE